MICATRSPESDELFPRCRRTLLICRGGRRARPLLLARRGRRGGVGDLGPGSNLSVWNRSLLLLLLFCHCSVLFLCSTSWRVQLIEQVAGPAPGPGSAPARSGCFLQGSIIGMCGDGAAPMSKTREAGVGGDHGVRGEPGEAIAGCQALAPCGGLLTAAATWRWLDQRAHVQAGTPNCPAEVVIRQC